MLVTRGHVRIDVLYGNLGARAKAAFDLVAIVGLAILVLAIVDRTGEIFLDNLAGANRSNTPLRIPLAWPQAPWFAGFVLFLAVTVLAFLRSLLALVRGDLGTVSATIGVPSQDEEVKSELGSLGIGTPNTGGEEVDMLGTALVLLIALLAVSVPVAAVMGVPGPGAQPVLLVHPALPGDGRHRVERQLRIHPDRHPDVRDAGRNPVAARASPIASMPPSRPGSPGCRAA